MIFCDFVIFFYFFFELGDKIKTYFPNRTPIAVCSFTAGSLNNEAIVQGAWQQPQRYHLLIKQICCCGRYCIFLFFPTIGHVVVLRAS